MRSTCNTPSFFSHFAILWGRAIAALPLWSKIIGRESDLLSGKHIQIWEWKTNVKKDTNRLITCLVFFAVRWNPLPLGYSKKFRHGFENVVFWTEIIIKRRLKKHRTAYLHLRPHGASSHFHCPIRARLWYPRPPQRPSTLMWNRRLRPRFILRPPKLGGGGVDVGPTLRLPNRSDKIEMNGSGGGSVFFPEGFICPLKSHRNSPPPNRKAHLQKQVPITRVTPSAWKQRRNRKAPQ